MVNCINLIIEMSPRFVLGRENVPCVAEVVNRSLKADCTDFTQLNASNQVKFLRLLSPLILQKMKDDNISQLGDYDAPFCEQYTHGSFHVFFSNSNHLISLIPPKLPKILDIYSVVAL